MIRYTWGMHSYLRRLLRRRPRKTATVRIVIESNADAARESLDGFAGWADPTRPLAYRPEPVDQDAPGWGPAPFRRRDNNA